MISKKEFEYTVGRNLAKYRNEKKLTQMQVAEMAELSVPFYASVELGNKGAGQAALDGAADGFMTGGFCALGGSVVGGAVRTIRNAKSGITIGKMGTFEDVSRLANTQHYSGLKEFDFIKKVAGKKTAEAIGWWQKKCVVKGVMALNGSIYDCGGALTGAYAKEVALTRG